MTIFSDTKPHRIKAFSLLLLPPMFLYVIRGSISDQIGLQEMQLFYTASNHTRCDICVVRNR